MRRTTRMGEHEELVMSFTLWGNFRETTRQLSSVVMIQRVHRHGSKKLRRSSE